MTAEQLAGLRVELINSTTLLEHAVDDLINGRINAGSACLDLATVAMRLATAVDVLLAQAIIQQDPNTGEPAT